MPASIRSALKGCKSRPQGVSRRSLHRVRYSCNLTAGSESWAEAGQSSFVSKGLPSCPSNPGIPGDRLADAQGSSRLRMQMLSIHEGNDDEHGWLIVYHWTSLEEASESCNGQCFRRRGNRCLSQQHSYHKRCIVLSDFAGATCQA